MSTDCENLLKKFLVLNPTRRSALEVSNGRDEVDACTNVRSSLQAIMKDKWMNISYENDELRPFEEPSQDFNDLYRIGESSEQSRQRVFTSFQNRSHATAVTLASKYSTR